MSMWKKNEIKSAINPGKEYASWKERKRVQEP